MYRPPRQAVSFFCDSQKIVALSAALLHHRSRESSLRSPATHAYKRSMTETKKHKFKIFLLFASHQDKKPKAGCTVAHRSLWVGFFICRNFKTFDFFIVFFNFLGLLLPSYMTRNRQRYEQLSASRNVVDQIVYDDICRHDMRQPAIS